MSCAFMTVFLLESQLGRRGLEYNQYNLFGGISLKSKSNLTFEKDGLDLPVKTLLGLFLLFGVWVLLCHHAV